MRTRKLAGLRSWKTALQRIRSPQRIGSPTENQRLQSRSRFHFGDFAAGLQASSRSVFRCRRWIFEKLRSPKNGLFRRLSTFFDRYRSTTQYALTGPNSAFSRVGHARQGPENSKKMTRQTHSAPRISSLFDFSLQRATECAAGPVGRRCRSSSRVEEVGQ